MLDILRSIVGMFFFTAVCWYLSENRQRVSPRLLLSCLILQVAFALLLLGTPLGDLVFVASNWALNLLFDSVGEGSRFIFGDLVETAPFFAKVLPTVVVMSALMAVLYHRGVMQRVVYFFGKLFEKTLGTSGAESLSAAANIFVGQTESPLLIRPYLAKLTRSELMVVMTGGMATVAGGVMAAYVGILGEHFPDIAGHLITASIISAPGAVYFAKLLVPESSVPDTLGGAKVEVEVTTESDLHAITEGTREGIPLFFNILFMLLVFLTAIYFANAVWGALCGVIHTQAGIDCSGFDTFQELVGYLFLPIAWLLGISLPDLHLAAVLLGEKIFFNEFVSYLHLGTLLSGDSFLPGGSPHEFTERSKLILVYALCGFANFSSIGILIGGLGILTPERTAEIASLGIKSMIAATLACFMTATIASLVLSF